MPLPAWACRAVPPQFPGRAPVCPARNGAHVQDIRKLTWPPASIIEFILFRNSRSSEFDALVSVRRG